MGWEVKPSDNVIITPTTEGKANITFPVNELHQTVTYTITYTDGNGNCGVYEITQDAKTNGPCDLKPVNVGLINKDGAENLLIFTYPNDICGEGNFEITTITSGINVEYNKNQTGRIKATFPPNSGPEREIKIQVKQTRDGVTDTATYTFTQAGTE